jgi:drug/metabolite transporter (DMT)-like permease
VATLPPDADRVHVADRTPSQRRRDAALVRAAWMLACLLWSATFLFIRIGVSDVGPFTFAAARLLIALLVLTPLVALRGEWVSWTRADVNAVLCAGLLLLGVNYALVYWGAQFVPSGLVAILLATGPIVALGLGALVGKEAITIRKVAAVSLGLLGVVAIFGVEAATPGGGGLRGAAALLASACCMAASYVWMKGRSDRVPPLSMAALQSGSGLVVLAALAVVREGSPLDTRWSATAIGALLYLGGAASVLAFWLNYWLLARMDTSAMLMMGVAEVPIAIILGAVFLGERLPSGTWLGGACIVASVVLGPLQRVDSPAKTARRAPSHRDTSTQ